jgi:hypothetical protein
MRGRNILLLAVTTALVGLLGASAVTAPGGPPDHGTLHLPRGGYGFRFSVLDGGVPVLEMDPRDPVVGIAVL